MADKLFSEVISYYHLSVTRPNAAAAADDDDDADCNSTYICNACSVSIQAESEMLAGDKHEDLPVKVIFKAAFDSFTATE